VPREDRRASLSDRRHLCGFADAYVPAKVYAPGDAATTAVLEDAPLLAMMLH
jgi:hypothetical protein